MADLAKAPKYVGAEYLDRPAFAGKPMSPLGREVADILGQVWRGIYHLRRPERFDWSNPYYIEIRITQELATYDGLELTALVVLCHDHAIRLSVAGCAPRTLRLLFHKRQREGDITQRHPTIEHAVEIVRTHLGLT